MKLLKSALSLILAVLLALPFPAGVAWADAIGQQKENEIGQRFHLKIASTGTILDDPVANEYYKKITDRIMKSAGLRSDQYHFYIINSGSINAFAVPGGYIYMNTETIISLENEGQLASIVGHEIAHITSRHFARRMEAAGSLSLAYIASMLAGALLASQGGGAAALGQALMVGGMGATVSSMMANSRADEAEADAKGRDYLIGAGYNPRDMYGAFKIMSDRSGLVSTGSQVPTYLTTHPSLSSRLATTFSDLQNSPAASKDVKYDAFRDRILALSGEPRRIQALMERRLRENSQDHSAIHALALLAAREQNLSQAATILKKALALVPRNSEYLADLGEIYLRLRQPKEAQKYFTQAGSKNRQALLGSARAAELLGDSKKAATFYDKAINFNLEPYPEAYEFAGRFFGQAAQKAKGHYYTGRYFQENGDLKEAIFHFTQVASQSSPAPWDKRAQREKNILERIQKDD